MSYNCDDCGRFINYSDHDEFTHFGSSADLEPPDPVIICARCAQHREENIVDNTKPPARPYIPWQLGRFHYRAIARLGMVLAGPEHAAWCEAFWPGQVPWGYTVRDNKPMAQSEAKR